MLYVLWRDYLTLLATMIMFMMSGAQVTCENIDMAVRETGPGPRSQQSERVSSHSEGPQK